MTRWKKRNGRKWTIKWLCKLRVTFGFPDSSAGKEKARLIPALGRSTGEGIGYPFQSSWASLVTQLVKNLPAMQETWVQILGLGRSPGEGKGYPIQYSGLGNSVNCIVHVVTKSQTWLSNFHFYFALIKLIFHPILIFWISPIK